MWRRAKKEQKEDNYLSVIDGLKKIYESKIKPVEQLYQFDEFHSPLLANTDFEAKPQVLLLGQYSTGKTSFIKYLLERDFPGAHIGPEPTTDRWIAVMGGEEDLVIPGNALAIQSDKPFKALSKHGNDFLNKFQCSQCTAPILEDITFIDTPGVLSGEKQRIGRSYDFIRICEWFAEKSDLILLLFDAHKLDISDEFKAVIDATKSHTDKIRIVLNKADMITTQQLMRVYGALMWSLGKVFQTPEVMRVYIGSFWDQPYNIKDMEKLFQAEQADLFADLAALPRLGALRKVNELVKRARLAKVHAHIIAHLKEEMPSVFGKGSKQQELIKNLKNEFLVIHKKYNLPVGDFPNLLRFQEQLGNTDFTKFAKLNLKLINSMDVVLGEDIPKLMKMFPQEHNSYIPQRNPFEGEDPLNQMDQKRVEYLEVFQSLGPVDGKLSGTAIKQFLAPTGLAREVLSKIWSMSDRDKDGALNEDEFVYCKFLVDLAKEGKPLPEQLPHLLKLPSHSNLNNDAQ